MKKLIVAIAAVLSLGTYANAAKFDIKNLEVGMGLADSMPMGDAGDAYKSGIGFDFHADYQLNDMFAAGIEYFGATYTAKYDVISYGYNFGKGPDAATSYEAVYGKYLLPSMDIGGKKAKFYGIVGLGIYSVADYNNFSSVSDVVKIGLGLGAGATMEVAQNWNVGLELRYHLVSKFSTFAPALKVGYHF